MSVAVVIPSIRSLADAQLDALAGADIIVVDGGGFRLGPGQSHRVRVLSLDDQRALVDGDLTLIGHGSAACRNVGVLAAHRDNYDVIVNLDDDCWPEESDFIAQYVNLLTHGATMRKIHALDASRWTSTLHREGDATWFPRGFPYENRATHQQVTLGSEHVTPAVHMGLWTEDLDLNAVDKVAYHGQSFELRRELYVASNFFPVCAMNTATTRDWAPFTYQIPWSSFGTTLGLGRYDDIIGGLITATLAHQEGARLSFGPPFVRHHKKDVDLLTHAAQENLGNVVIGRLAAILGRDLLNVPPNQSTRMYRAQDLISRLEWGERRDAIGLVLGHITSMYRRWLELFR